MKKFLLPFQNMVRADLFSGSLAVWNVRGGAAPSEGQNPFELFLIYSAIWKIANPQASRRPERRPIRTVFEAKKPFQILAERRLCRREASLVHLRNPDLRRGRIVV